MDNNRTKLKVAILGSGNIGADLLIKILRSEYLECSLFIGRNLSSRGISKAIGLGVKVSDQSIEAIIKDPDSCDLVFDATSAMSHKYHAPILEKLGKKVIDLTPAEVGKMCVPAVNIQDCIKLSNINVITCGGQASIPIAYIIGQTVKDVEYIEVVSTIASRSAGPATRANLDEYIETTEKALAEFSGCKKTKAILVLNPAQPCIDMQTTIFAKAKNPDMKKVSIAVTAMVKTIQGYVPGYNLLVEPILEDERIFTMIKVQGKGDYLPSYAGNLDIINCAAIAIAEEYAKSMLKTRA